ncbi:hypothetical protein [Xanthobacter sp. KR7-225]|uniref:helix-turn-helix transcriptional regulator n=1 Tax=Xanthobacter sp. KR7-225 TaxID=3156613 RepID=UPI0032B46BE2
MEDLPPHLNRKWFRPEQAAEYIEHATGVPCALATLATWRCRGGGPAFHKVGRAVTYHRAEIDIWAAARVGAPMNSTSEVRP